MIEGRQVPVASALARKLTDVRTTLRALEEEAWRVGLDEDARRIGSIADHASKVSRGLEQKAIDRYLAARRGELP